MFRRVKVEGFYGDCRVFDFCDGVDNHALAVEYAKKKRKNINANGFSHFKIEILDLNDNVLMEA